jgi:hypothetical protein
MLRIGRFKRIEFQSGRGGFDLLGEFFQQRFRFTVAWTVWISLLVRDWRRLS